MPSAEQCPIVVLGSLNLDLSVQVPRLPRPGETVRGQSSAEHPGGKGANQAVAAARLSGRVALFGRVGRDDAGTFLVDALRREGVECQGVTADADEPTGRALVLVDPSGENQIVVIPGANGKVGAAEAKAAAATAAGGVLLCQLEIPVKAVAAAFEGAGDQTRLVLNAAPARSLPTDVLRQVDVLVVNEPEAAAIAKGRDGQPDAERLLGLGPAAVVITLGRRGALLATTAGRVQVPPFHADAVDTTASGDAFVGALAAGMAQGLDLETCCRLGAAAGALACTRPGALPSLPTRDELKRFLKGSDLASTSF